MFQKGFIVIIIYFLAYWDHTLAYSPKEGQNPEIELSPRISPITDKNIFRDSSFYHWCGSIIKGPDKKYHMVYSRWHKQKTFLGWLTKSTIAHAVSDQPKPMIEDWDTEDVSLWYDNQVQRYYAVFHAHSYIGFMTSADGLNWKKARNFKILEKNISRSDGKPNLIPDRMERPFVYVEQNVPKVLLTAILKDDDSSIVTIPLHDDPEK